jgi:hypothetical protein
VWHPICGTPYVSSYMWHPVCDNPCVTPNVWHPICSTQYVAPNMWHPICGTQYVAPHMWHPICGTPYELQRKPISSAKSAESNVAASYFGISLRPFCFPSTNTSLISPGWTPCNSHTNPLTPKLNPAAQHCLTRFFTGDFAS